MKNVKVRYVNSRVAEIIDDIRESHTFIMAESLVPHICELFISRQGYYIYFEGKCKITPDNGCYFKDCVSYTTDISFDYLKTSSSTGYYVEHLFNVKNLVSIHNTMMF